MVPVGIAGVSVQEAERDVPPGEPPAWPENEKLSVVGKPTMRYAGQPIDAVAATSQSEADEAVRSIKIEYDIKPFVVDIEKARKEDAPMVNAGPVDVGGTAGGGGGARNATQKGNVRSAAAPPERLAEIEKAFEEAETIVEGEYKTQVQTHSPLETHGVVADWKPDMLTVWASTQGTASVRDEM